MVGKPQTHKQTESIWWEVGPGALGARDEVLSPKGIWKEMTPELSLDQIIETARWEEEKECSRQRGDHMQRGDI